jgi:hypothetical protein
MWIKELGLKMDEQNKPNMGFIFGTAFVLEFIAAILMDAFLGPNATLSSGVLLGLFVGIGWVATSIGTNYLFASKSLKLFIIDAGYFIVWFTVIGAILGVW